MEQIRYKQRICTDKEKIEEFLLHARVGVVGMDGGDYPYCVPVNYIWYDGSIYFHGMGSGKKTEILDKNPSVSFTIFEEYGTVKDDVPCHADTSYMSAMIFGKAERVTDSSKGALVLQLLVEKYMPDYYKNKLSGTLIEKYRSSHDNKAVSIFKISQSEMTVKGNYAEPDDLFKVSP